MKLCTCEFEGRTFAAAVSGGRVYEAAPDMLSLIRSLNGKAPGAGLVRGEGINIEDVRLLAPIPEPAQDVICLGMNYRDHSAEAARWGKDDFIKNEGKAVYFSKRAARIIGTGEEIDGHFDIVDGLDYEAELAVVIGRDAYRVSEAEAESFVFGYSVLNDVSARNLQREHKQYYFGKSLDTHTVMGPCIVTRDEFAFPPDLAIRCYVNGELRQNGRTADLIFGVARVISELSQGMTLKAGSIIATGTPAGVGMGFVPPRYLAAGDFVVCEIEGIGKLENRVSGAF